MKTPIILRNLLLGFLFVSPSLVATAQTPTWQTVRIGGCGNVTSVNAHPAVPNLFFITTDVGNCYRWNNTAQRWEPMLNNLDASYWPINACADLAADPSDATGNIVYATLGRGAANTWDAMGKVMKSTDRGNSWTYTGLPIWVGANNDQSRGERIAVDPQNSNVIWVTTRAPQAAPLTGYNGTYKSTNAASTWSQVNSLYGNFLLFDTSGGLVSGVTKNIMIGCDDGVYRSTDGGNTFALMSGSPANARKASIHSNGTMYVTTTSGAFKWNGSAWSNVSPAAGAWQGVDVNPNNSNQVLVCNYDGAHYRSLDGGTSWTHLSKVADKTEIPWFTGSIGLNSNDFCWDPFNANHAWFTDFFDVHETTDVYANTVTWKARAVGHEELVTSGTLLCPPAGGPNLVHSSSADVGGFDHRSLIDPPTANMVTFFPWTRQGASGNMTGVAVRETNPNLVARVGRRGWDGTAYAGYSTDGGTSYTIFSKYPIGESGGRIAIAATSDTMLWATQGGYTYRSTNLGAAWTKITSLPIGLVPGTNIFDGGYPHPLAADKVNGNKFYAYNAGKLYVSTDAGATFTIANSTLPNISSVSYVKVETSPGIEGDVWVSFGAWTGPGFGLYHSTNSGATFTQISNVQIAHQMSVGKAASTIPAVYVFGKVNNIDNGTFRSDDNGATWTQINDPAVNPGQYRELAADRNVYGRVFLSAGGNGIFYYGVPPPPPPPPPGPEVIVDNLAAEFTGTWTSSTAKPNYYAADYVYHLAGSGANKARWRPSITTAGNYSVYYRVPNGDSTRASNAPFTVYFNGGSQTYLVNEQSASGGIWLLLGTHNFAAGTAGYVELTDNANSSYVIADAVKFVSIP